jgi:hypothetical protein
MTSFNVSFLNDGILQIAVYTYILKEHGVRSLSSKDWTAQRTVKFQLPVMLTSQYWNFHGLDTANVMNIISSFSPRALWKCALLLGISCTNSAIKLAHDHKGSIVLGSRNVVMSKLEKAICHSIQKNNSTYIVGTHVPQLPLHFVSSALYLEILEMMPDISPICFFEKLIFSKSLLWKSRRFVPIKLEPYGIVCVHVVLCTEYPRTISGMYDRPLLVEIAGVDYYGIEEMCYFEKVKAEEL